MGDLIGGFSISQENWEGEKNQSLSKRDLGGGGKEYINIFNFNFLLACKMLALSLIHLISYGVNSDSPLETGINPTHHDC